MEYGDVDRAVSHTQFLKYAEDLAAVYELERKRREELKQVYEGISDLVHSIQDGVFIVHSSGVISEINLPACLLLGQDRAWIIGKPVDQVLHQACATHPLPPPEQTQQSAHGQTQTLHLSSGNILRLTYTSMKNGWTFCLLRDATEEVRVENIKHDFLALLSHELRTPLTGILGFSELLMENSESYLEFEREAVTSIHESGMRMFRIVDELLKFANLQSEHREAHQEPLQVPLLISNVFEQLEPIAQSKGISLFIHHDAGLPIIIRGNALMLRELFKHVIQNSIIYGKENGNVTVRIQPSENETITIAVEDDGIGIPAECIGKVFNSFYQVEDTLRRNYQGLGLGLSISRIITRIHGGSISLSSDLHQGTTCVITLPVNALSDTRLHIKEENA